MKTAATAVVFATLLLAATPVMAGNPAEPSAPGSDKTPGVTPSDANASPTIETPESTDTVKPTGASDPATPDPTRNTPGAETKN